MSYPTALDALTNPTSSDTLDTPSHADQHADANDAIEALETKLGTGSSTPTTAGHALRVTAAGATAYGAIQSSDLPSGWFDVTEYGAEGDGTTDDTDAIQDAIDACEDAGGGTVYFPAGVYKVAGALQDTSRSNSQLLLPRRDYVDTEQITIILRGDTPPSPIASVIGTTPIPDNGSVIKGTLNTGSGSLLGGHGPSGTFDNFTNITLQIENLTFRMSDNPKLTALDLSCVAAVDLRNVSVDTGSFDLDTLTEPDTTTSVGIRLPGNNNGAKTRLDNVLAVGFYTGIECGEHVDGDGVTVMACIRALTFITSGHASHFGRVLVQHCQYTIHVSGTSYFSIEQLDIEHAADVTWQVTTYDLDDGSDQAVGEVRWHVALEHTGVDDTFLVNSAANIRYSRLGTPRGYGEGDAFPASPADHDKFYRTDRDLLYFYDGTRWLTVNEYSLSMSPLDALQPLSATGTGAYASTDHGDNQMYVTRIVANTYVITTTNSTNYWTIQFNHANAAGTDTALGSSFNTKLDTGSNYARHVVTVNATVPTTAFTLRAKGTKTSAPGNLYIIAAVIYRLVG